MSLLLLFAPRSSAAPAPRPASTSASGGGGASAILRAAWREQRIKKDNKDLEAIVPAVLLLLRGRS